MATIILPNRCDVSSKHFFPIPKLTGIFYPIMFIYTLHIPSVLVAEPERNPGKCCPEYVGINGVHPLSSSRELGYNYFSLTMVIQ